MWSAEVRKNVSAAPRHAHSARRAADRPWVVERATLAAMPVLLEDDHIDEHSWKEVADIPDPNARIAPPKPSFTTWLTTMVTIVIVGTIAAVAFGHG